MQIDVNYKAILVLTVVALPIFFFVIPPLIKGIVNRLKRIGGVKKRD